MKCERCNSILAAAVFAQPWGYEARGKCNECGHITVESTSQFRQQVAELQAALRASTELLRQGAYRMVQTAPKEYYRTLDQIDANEAALGGGK